MSKGEGVRGTAYGLEGNHGVDFRVGMTRGPARRPGAAHGIRHSLEQAGVRGLVWSVPSWIPPEPVYGR